MEETALTPDEARAARKIGARRLPLQVQGEPGRSRAKTQLAALAQPAPAKPRARIEFLLVPAFAKTDERPFAGRLELFDRDPSAR